MRYVIQRGFPLATASLNPVHLADDLDIFGWRLSPEQMAMLRAVRFPPASARPASRFPPGAPVPRSPAAASRRARS